MKTDGWVVQESILNLIPHRIRAHFPPSPLCVVRNLNVLDMYGCEARVARWAQLFQLNAVAFDPLYSPEKMCLETSHGTALALLLMFRIIPGGLVTFISPGFSTWAPETANALYGRSLKNVYGDMSTFGVQRRHRLIHLIMGRYLWLHVRIRKLLIVIIHLISMLILLLIVVHRFIVILWIWKIRLWLIVSWHGIGIVHPVWNVSIKFFLRHLLVEAFLFMIFWHRASRINSAGT